LDLTLSSTGLSLAKHNAPTFLGEHTLVEDLGSDYCRRTVSIPSADGTQSCAQKMPLIVDSNNRHAIEVSNYNGWQSLANVLRKRLMPANKIARAIERAVWSEALCESLLCPRITEPESGGNQLLALAAHPT